MPKASTELELGTTVGCTAVQITAYGSALKRIQLLATKLNLPIMPTVKSKACRQLYYSMVRVVDVSGHPTDPYPSALLLPLEKNQA